MQSRVKLLGSTALAAAALVLGAPTASAGKHTSLEKRVQALEKAGGQSVTRSKKTMKLVVNGHINRAVTYTDNGTQTGFSNVTQAFSQTRVRWIATGKINDDLSVRSYIELGNASASSFNQQSLDSGGDSNPAAALDERHIDLQITSKSIGKLYMGQGSSGSDSTSEVDLSGTAVISLNGFGELLGGAETFQLNGAPAAGGGTVRANFNNMDGLGRRDRIRYDTPKFAGLQLTTSYGNEDAHDVALRYGASLGSVKVKAAVAYANNKLAGGNSATNGSVSVLLPFGLSLTAGAAKDSASAEWLYGKVGYRFNGFEMGETRLFADYNHNEEVGSLNSESNYIGVGVVQILEPLGAELYAVYRVFELELPGQDPDDIDSIAVGARFSF